MARRFVAGAATSVAALSLLTACSGIGGSSPTCPTVGVVQGAGQLTRFVGSDLTDVEFEAQVGNLVAECEFDSDSRTGSIDLDIMFRTQRGPASAATEHEFGYFVAVVDPEGDVAARTPFSVRVAFDGNRTEVAKPERLALDIPVRENTSLRAYRIYVGMQLTKTQFDYNLNGRR